MLQAWVMMLDMGFGPALSREMSRFRAGALSPTDTATRLRTLEYIQSGLGILAIGLLWIASGWIGKHWFLSTTINPELIAQCIKWMGIAAVLRWLAGLHRSALVGLERQYWVNGLVSGFATLRFVGVLPILAYVSSSPLLFFLFQAAVSTLEFVVYFVVVHREIPRDFNFRAERGDFTTMLPIIGNMALLSGIWALMTQLDKLILSGILPLQAYGYFTLAVMAANGVLILIPPLHQIIQPRMTILVEQAQRTHLVTLYRLASQFAVIVFTGLGGGLAFFAEPVLQIWTGNAMAAQFAAPILFWYGLANAVVGILVLPFMLQFAEGKLRLHVLGTGVLLLFLIPALVLSAKYFGGAGAGFMVFSAQLLFLLLWVPLVHSRFLPELNWRWLFMDTLPIAMTMVAALATSAHFMGAELSTIKKILWIGCTIFVVIVLGVLTGNWTRRTIKNTLWKTHG